MVIVMMRVIKDCWAGYGCYSDGSGRAGGLEAELCGLQDTNKDH